MTRAAIALAIMLVAAPSSAGQLAGVTMPDEVSVAGKTLVLNGLGLREATALMVDVYVAGLYVEGRSTDAEPILSPSTGKRIVMKFLRSVGREKLAAAWTEGFEKNAGDKASTVAPGLATMNAAMDDVKKDDTIVLTFVPGAGTTVSVKGQDVAAIPGDDFQRVLFSVWLGPQPPNVSLRDGMLGRTASP